MNTPALFDAAGIAWRADGGGGAALQCPCCRRWVKQIVLSNQGRVSCWRCVHAPPPSPLPPPPALPA